MDITYEPAALIGLKAMPKSDSKRLRDALEQIAAEHPNRMSFVTEMVGQENTWRARKGDYRALLTIAGNQMTVIAVGNRKDIYK